MRSSLNPACDCRASLVAELMRRPAAAEYATDPLRPLLASLIAGRACGAGVLPTRLGLEPPDFTALWDHYFPGPPLSLEAGRCQDLPELDDLIDLLLSYRAGKSQAEGWVARLVAHGCAGRDHLWQDLGLADRNELSLLMETAFPSLAALNRSDMKWKKLIYRHYCQRDGLYLCPAPSCGACADYALCFGPEDQNT
ncbi:nitrogen fixation protein NifQ [Thermochromatium tepidum]|nr:nitrogen fixation protein NifQ [Thermochromatium tepidum]